MDDAELNRRLRSLPPSAPGEPYFATFPDRVLSRLEANERLLRPARQLGRPILLLGSLALAALALVIGIRVGQTRQARADAPSYAWLGDDDALREVFSMFPHRVQAVVEDASGVHVVLSDTANVPDSPAVWIEASQGNHREVAVTFSGQVLELAGARVEVLSNPHGDVTLVGDNQVWSTALSPAPMGAWRVQAHNLGKIL